MYVCHCRAITDRTVAACIAAGAASVEEVTRGCGAGGRCGGCIPAIEALLSEVRVAVGTGARSGSLAPVALDLRDDVAA